MPQCQFLFSSVFGFRKVVQEIFSELDRVTTEEPPTSPEDNDDQETGEEEEEVCDFSVHVVNFRFLRLITFVFQEEEENTGHDQAHDVDPDPNPEEPVDNPSSPAAHQNPVDVETPVTKKRERHAVAKVPRSRLSNSSLNPSSQFEDTQDKEENTSKKRSTRSSGSSELEAGLPYKPSHRRVMRPPTSPTASHPLAGRMRQS